MQILRHAAELLQKKTWIELIMSIASISFFLDCTKESLNSITHQIGLAGTKVQSMQQVLNSSSGRHFGTLPQIWVLERTKATFVDLQNHFGSEIVNSISTLT